VLKGLKCHDSSWNANHGKNNQRQSDARNEGCFSISRVLTCLLASIGGV